MVPNKVKNKLKEHSKKITDVLGKHKYDQIEAGNISRGDLAEISLAITGGDDKRPKIKGE